MSQAIGPSKVFQIADRYVTEIAALDPNLATAIGVPGHEREMTDYSPDGPAAIAALNQKTMEELDGVPISDDRDRSALGARPSGARRLPPDAFHGPRTQHGRLQTTGTGGRPAIGDLERGPRFLRRAVGPVRQGGEGHREPAHRPRAGSPPRQAGLRRDGALAARGVRAQSGRTRTMRRGALPAPLARITRRDDRPAGDLHVGLGGATQSRARDGGNGAEDRARRHRRGGERCSADRPRSGRRRRRGLPRVAPATARRDDRLSARDAVRYPATGTPRRGDDPARGRSPDSVLYRAFRGLFTAGTYLVAGGRHHPLSEVGGRQHRLSRRRAGTPPPDRRRALPD